MEWRRQIAATGDLLEGIVWLLLALADLAERAAFAPAARRRLVLAILRSGETAARDAFASRATQAAFIKDAPGPLPGDGPEDALALAQSLRALALIVRALAAPLRRLARLAGDTGHRRGPRRPARRFLVARICEALFPPAPRLDTS